MNLADNLWPDVNHLLSPGALEKIAANSTDADRHARIDEDVFSVLKQAGYFGIAVPEKFEGKGASVEQCCAVQRALGMADPGLAVGLNMHLFSVGVLLEHWRIKKDVSWALLEAIATQARLVASAFAEPGLGGSILRSRCRGNRVPGGYIVTGVKSPCSLIGRSDLVCLQFQSDEATTDSLLVALVPTELSGFEVIRTWDTLGMRGSESDTLKMTEAFIPDDLVFHRTVPGYDDDPVFGLGLCWFCVTTTATYLGAANACLRLATAQLLKAPMSVDGVPRGHLPTFQSSLGELIAQYLTLEHSCISVARMLDADERTAAGVLPSALALKCAAVDMCTRIASMTMEMCGGIAYSNKSPLSRLLRDMHAISFHPPTRLVSRQILGRYALDLPIRFELCESPSIE